MTKLITILFILFCSCQSRIINSRHIVTALDVDSSISIGDINYPRKYLTRKHRIDTIYGLRGDAASDIIKNPYWWNKAHNKWDSVGVNQQSIEYKMGDTLMGGLMNGARCPIEILDSVNKKGQK